MKPHLKIVCVPDGFEILIDIGMELIVFSMEKDLLFLDGDQRHPQVEQIVFILLVYVVVKDLINQRDLDVPTTGWAVPGEDC